MPVFFGGPAVHYVKPGDGHWPPLCGDTGAEAYTHSEDRVDCRDCCAILGIEPAGRTSQEEEK